MSDGQITPEGVREAVLEQIRKWLEEPAGRPSTLSIDRIDMPLDDGSGLMRVFEIFVKNQRGGASHRIGTERRIVTPTGPLPPPPGGLIK